MVRVRTLALLGALLYAMPAFAVEIDVDNNGAVDIAKGGTNAKTAAGARLNLGTTIPSNITQDSTHRFATDAEKALWNNATKLFKDQEAGDHVDQVRYSSALAKLQYWNGSSWAELNLQNHSIMNAQTLGGNLPAAFATAGQGATADAALPATSYTAADVLTKTKTVDGTGSGLDADTVDGSEPSALSVAYAANAGAVGGTALTGLLKLVDFSKTIGASTWVQPLPGGLVLQGGYIASRVGVVTSHTFPRAYTGGCLGVFFAEVYTAQHNDNPKLNSTPTLTGFEIHSDAPYPLYWFSIGYDN